MLYFAPPLAPVSRPWTERSESCCRATHSNCRILLPPDPADADPTGLIADADAAHPYAQLFAGLPRVGTLNLAQVLGEVGPILERTTSFDQLVAETGIAPVTRASGKTHAVSFQYATNRRARQALVISIDNSRRSSGWAAGRYAQARARGQRHPHAIRTLCRTWLRIIWPAGAPKPPRTPTGDTLQNNRSPRRG